MKWHTIRQNWERMLETVARLGGDVRPLVIERPASKAEIAATERRLGAPLPSSLRSTLLEFSRHVEFSWYLPGDLKLPPALAGVFSGDCHWSLEWLVKANQDKDGWLRAVYSQRSDPPDRVWQGKLAFLAVGNGDFLAIDITRQDDQPIIYLSHDYGEGHGHRMAADFQDLLYRWSSIGCPGAEDWQWLPFTNDGSGFVDPESPKAILWRDVLGF